MLSASSGSSPWRGATAYISRIRRSSSPARLMKRGNSFSGMSSPKVILYVKGYQSGTRTPPYALNFASTTLASLDSTAT